ncbi:gamma-glutamylcyclotransferase [Methanolobus sp. WCC5]|uniref:gamma-glutamylcyclotransferase family protein n=1 Tax=Methanolobus sp. WCC5 TaxID=3125785 RepID=UPI00325664EC
MYLFVYGTLKAGNTIHQLLKDSEYIGTARTAEKFIMLDLGSFPGVLKDTEEEKNDKRRLTPHISTFIYGEVYKITPETLEALDRYEGEWYFREEVQLGSGMKALMYILRKRPVADFPVIRQGRWLK